MNKTESLSLSWQCIVCVAILGAALAAADMGSRVALDGEQCVLVDGKRFFPVGIHSAGVEDFPKLAEAGFNLVHTYGW